MPKSKFSFPSTAGKGFDWFHDAFQSSSRGTGVKGGTDLLGALQFVSPAAGCGIRFIIVSDGRPEDEFSTLTYAKQMREKLNCIHIGSDRRGKEFMKQLAASSEGQALESEVQLLSDNIQKLLMSGGKQ